MTAYTYTFKSVTTGELRSALARSLNSAAYNLFGRDSCWPWVKWECWDGDRCVWYVTDDGEMHAGARSSKE